MMGITVRVSVDTSVRQMGRPQALALFDAFTENRLLVRSTSYSAEDA